MNKGQKTTEKDRERSSARVVVNTLFATFKQSDLYAAANMPAIYDELRRLLRLCQQHQRAGNSSRAQPVLQEAFQRLFGQHVEAPVSGQLTLLAALMRRVIVDHAKTRRQRDTRTGMRPLIDDLRQHPETAEIAESIDVLAMDAALEQLEQRHPSSARLIELRYFADLGSLDLALELGVTTVTIERNLRFAKTWLFAQLQNQNQNKG